MLSRNTAAIDFGTTNCSVIYTVERNEDPQRLSLSKFDRVPTAILFEPDGTIDSFGYEARAQYLDLDDDNRPKYAYFEQIEMTKVFIMTTYLCI